MGPSIIEIVIMGSEHLFEPFGPLKTPQIWNNPPGRYSARDLSRTTATLNIT